MNERYGDNLGIVYDNSREAVLTWSVESPAEDDFLTNNKLNRTSAFLSDHSVIPIDGYFVAPFGKQHNNLPMEVRELISKNPYLPELLEKQIRFLYGSGPYLYKQELRENSEGEVVVVRVPVENAEIQSWLDSWETNGLEDYRFFLLEQTREFYYSESLFQQYHFAKSRRTGGKLPVIGLEAVSSSKARLASTNPKYAAGATLEKKDFNYIIVGDWLTTADNKYKVFNLYEKAEPFKFPTAISYTKNTSYAEEIYSYLPWFYGLKEWIRASNLNPKYLNSFLRNSLSARLHCIIPYSWVISKREILQGLCKRNSDLASANKPIQEMFEGVKLGIEFREEMVSQLINNKLRQITELMSGEGKNQGKLFSSQSFQTENGIDQWKFEEIPMKSKEYIETIISLDKRAVDVILAGKGIDASLSNVSKDGIISKSGADAYYNYLIYLTTLSIPEFIITYDINNTIKLNFPKTDIRIGFWRPVVKRQEDVAPKKRMNNNTQ
jgi:hypothetical protein